MTLPARLRRTQYFFHDRAEAGGLLLNLLHDLFRSLRLYYQPGPGHFRLTPRVIAFCVVQNLTNWVHNSPSTGLSEKANRLSANSGHGNFTWDGIHAARRGLFAAAEVNPLGHSAKSLSRLTRLLHVGDDDVAEVRAGLAYM